MEVTKGEPPLLLVSALYAAVKHRMLMFSVSAQSHFKSSADDQAARGAGACLYISGTSN